MDIASLLAQAQADSAARLVLAEGPALLATVLTGDAPRKDLIAGRICELLVAAGRPRSTLAIVDGWLGSQQHNVPRRYGGTDARTMLASAYLAARVRDAMIALFAKPPATFTDREEFLLAFLWRQYYLNPFSAIHLMGGMRGAAPAGGSDVIASLHAPFGAPERADADAVWEGPRPLVEKLIAALWLIALPQYSVEEPAIARAYANTVRVLRGARRSPPPGPAFEILVAEAMGALFGACYGTRDTLDGLTALGDLVGDEMPRRLRVAPVTRRPPRARPRIGYLSTCFREHAVSHYMGNRIICHDRERFEVIAFSVGQRRDQLTERIAAGADEFVELVDAENLQAVVDAVQAREVDLLVLVDVGMDVTMHLLGGMQMAARQIGIMGHATSTGLPTASHYLSGDHEAPGAQVHYREQLVCLPNLGAAQIPLPDPEPAEWRRELDLPADAVVFSNLNNGIKLMPERDHVYWEILARVPGSYLVLKPFFSRVSIDAHLVERLMAGARQRGVADRVRIVPPLPKREQCISLLAATDVQLDTFPFGGWTTNLDALWAGVPLVTQEGEVCRNRWGAAFLRHMGISDGIASDVDGYIAEAVKLGTDAVLRARIRATIKERAPVLFFNGPGAQPAYEAALADVIASLPA